MATLTAPLTTYSDTTPQKRMITDVISLVDPVDTPMIERLGGLDGASGKFTFVNQPSTIYEWLQDTHFPLTDSLGASITSATTTITVADAYKFQEGDIIDLGDGDQCWVSAIVSSTTLTATRNYNAAQASHANSGTITIVGQARLEGDDSDDRGMTDRTVGSNYTQIFHHEVLVSRTQRSLAQYGIQDELEYQAMKAVPSLTRLIEKQMFHGYRAAGSASTPRAFGGFSTFITTGANTIDGSTTVSQANFEDACEAMFTDGGFGPWDAPVSPANLQAIKNLLDSSNFLRVDMNQTSIGMKVDTVVTPFGDVNLVRDRWAPDADIWLIDPQHAGLLTYYPFTREPLAKTGDATKEEVVGEFGFCLRQGLTVHGAIRSLG